MTSLIPVLSLLILVLANGYFAVPVGDDRSSTPSLHVGLTTDQGVHLQFVPDGETSTLPITEQSTEVTMTTSTNGQLEDSISRLSRLFDEAFTSETSTVTTDKSPVEGLTATDLPSTTSESSTNLLEHHQRGTEDENESESSNESKRELDEDSEKNNQFESDAEAAKRDLLTESSTVSMSSFTSTSSDIAPHLYTTDSSTTTTESTTTVSSQLDTLETSTKKYTGLLKDDEKEIEKPTKPLKKQPKKPKVKSEDKSEEELKGKSKDDEEETKTPIKPLKKQPKKTIVKSEDKSEEESKGKLKDKSEEVVKVKQTQKPKLEEEDDAKDSSAPTAVFDQDALKDVSTMSSGVMVIDESSDLVVTGIPDKIGKLKTEPKEETKQLNQGKKSPHPEEEKSDN